MWLPERGRAWTSVSAAGCVAGCLLLAAPLASIQGQGGRRELVGFVRDSAGAPVDAATVEVAGALARTDARGVFQLWTRDVDTVTISVRRIGYLALSALLTARGGRWDTVVVELSRSPLALAAVKVQESPTRRALDLREFEQRRAKGLGVFLTRDEIAARNAARSSDLLRTVKGVRLVRLRDGRYGARFALHGGMRTNCAPDIWLDGQHVKGLEIDDVTATDIEAMELYESLATLPMEFSRGASAQSCGTIVIWTRVPG